MGRRKIEIQPLTDDRNRTVTFVKRKAGLFKKAHELAVLCQVDIAVIIVGNNNKVYEFSSVDTNELLNAYKNVRKPHESKTPANYGNYEKKRKLGLRTSSIDDNSFSGEEEDSENDSDVSEPHNKKRSKRTSSNGIHFTQNDYSGKESTHGYTGEPAPPFNVARSDASKVSVSSVTDGGRSMVPQRPILRVQIPSNMKDTGKDSARTITAVNTNINPTETAGNSDRGDFAKNGDQSSSSSTSVNAPNIETFKFSGYSTFKSPDTKKPTLPIPITNKSQTSSPLSATAPPLPMNGMATFFASLPQPSPSSQFPTNSMLPTPLINQVFNQYSQVISNPAHGGSNQESATTLNANQQGKIRQQWSNQNGVPPNFANQGEQTPYSALPSRYMNDMFPSPSNFYVMQDWANGSTGMTPLNNMHHYLMQSASNSAAPLKIPNSSQMNSSSKLQAAKSDTGGQSLIGVNSYDELDSNQNAPNSSHPIDNKETDLSPQQGQKRRNKKKGDL